MRDNKQSTKAFNDLLAELRVLAEVYASDRLDDLAERLKWWKEQHDIGNDSV